MLCAYPSLAQKKSEKCYYRRQAGHVRNSQAINILYIYIALNLQWTPSYMLYIVIIAIGMAIFSMEGSRHLSVYFFKSDPIWIQSYSDKLLPSSQVCDSGNSQLTVLLFCYFQHKGLCNYATSILNKWLWKLAMYLVLLIELGKRMQVSDILYSLYVSCQNNC